MELDQTARSEQSSYERRYVRRVDGGGLAFYPWGLIPALGLALVTLFALFPFASGWIEHRAENAAQSALRDAGETWAQANASGQWVTLTGIAPDRESAARAVNLVREARSPTPFGWAKPVTRVSDRITLSARGTAELQPATSTPDAEPDTEADPPENLDSAPIPAQGQQSAEAISTCNRQFEELLASTKFEFASGSDVIANTDAPLLSDLTSAIQACAGEVSISGHTDSTGTNTLNQALSLARAEAVRDALIARGISADRLVAEGYASSRPIASNATREGREQNRRIEIKLSQSEEE